MRKKIFNKLFDLVNKYTFFSIIVFLILFFLFLFSYFFIPLKSDYIDLLPQNLESVKKLKYLSQKLKGIGQFSIVISSAEKNIESMIEIAELLYEKLKKLEEIDYINYKLPENFKKALFLFIELEDLKEIYNRLYEKVQYEILKNSAFNLGLEEEGAVEFNIDDIIEKYKNKAGSISFYESNYFISKDKDILVMFLKPSFLSTDIQKTEKLINKIKSIIEDIDNKKFKGGVSISFGGTYILTYDQKKTISEDIKRTSIIALVLIFFVILIFVKNIRYSIFLFLSLFTGVMSTFFFALIAFRHINLITGFLIALLTGLGVNYGTHFLLRYKEEKKIKESISALKESFNKTLIASFTGAATTAIAFFTLFFSKFLGFSEFGLLSSIGIMFTLFSTYIFVSAFIIFTDRLFKNKKNESINKTTEYSINSSSNYQKIFIVSTLALFIILIITTIVFFPKIKELKFEYDIKKLEVKNQKSILVTELIQKKFNISTDPVIFYTEKRDEEVDFYNTINRMKKNPESMIGNILTLSSLLNDEKVQLEKINVINKIRKEIKSLPLSTFKDKKVKNFIIDFLKVTESLSILKEENLPSEIKKRFIYEDKNSKLYISQVFPNKVLFDSREIKKYVNEVKEIKGEKGTYKTTGLHILYSYLADLVLNESRIFIPLVFIIIWIMVLLDFKSLKDSIIGILPLIFAFIWLLIIMSILKIKFNFMNIIVLPTILGTGIDNSIHLYHRYKECSNIFYSLKSTGKANFVMSLTVAIGWATLFFARYEGLKTMAIVGSLGIILTFISSIIIIPALVILFNLNNKTVKI